MFSLIRLFFSSTHKRNKYIIVSEFYVNFLYITSSTVILKLFGHKTENLYFHGAERECNKMGLRLFIRKPNPIYNLSLGLFIFTLVHGPKCNFESYVCATNNGLCVIFIILRLNMFDAHDI